MPLYTDDTAVPSFVPQSDVPVSFREVMGATFDQAVTELPSTSAQRLFELSRARGQGNKLSQSEAVARIRDAGLNGELAGEEGITDQALDIMIQRKQEELQRNSVLARRTGGFIEGAAGVGVSLAAGLMDPLNVASGFIPVFGEARYARLLGRAGESMFARAGVRAAVGAIEGVAGAAALEPLVFAAKTQEQADYEMADSLMNIGFGAVIGGVAHVGAGAIGDALRSTVPARIADGNQPRVQWNESAAKWEPSTSDDAIDVSTFLQSTKAVDDLGQPIKLQPDSADNLTFTRRSDSADQGSVYISMRNPVEIGYTGDRIPGVVDTAELRAAGHDGVIFRHADGEARDVYMPFDRRQVISVATAEPPTAIRQIQDSSYAVREAAFKSSLARVLDGKPVDAGPLFSVDPVRGAEGLQQADRVAEAKAAHESRAIDDEIAKSSDDVKALEEEATLAEQLAGVSESPKTSAADNAESAVVDDVAEQISTIKKDSARWTKAAELAINCLMRGV